MWKKLSLCCLLLPLAVHSEEAKEEAKVYRWMGKDGSVHFSAMPPPPGVESTEVELRQPDAVIHQEGRSQLLERGQQVDERIKVRQQERQRVLHQIDEVKASLAQAKETASAGEEPQPGERQRLASGGSRLSEAYHQRREAEAKRVEQLQQQLDGLYDQLNQLR